MSLDDDEAAKLREILRTWDDVQSGIRVVSAVGQAVKWLSAIVIAIASAIAIWEHRP